MNTPKTMSRALRLLSRASLAMMLVFSTAFPAGIACASDTVVIEEDEANETVVETQAPDQNDEVEVKVDQTDATERDVVVDEGEDQSISTQADPDSEINNILLSMSMKEKISQMIIPAIRTWGGDKNNVQDLSQYPDLATALKKYQYGGIILFGSNVSTVEQTGKLVNDLQENNSQYPRGGAPKIPYLMCVDGEGGVVVRFTMGTRMTGSMAVGATGTNAVTNAQTTGRVLGEEIASLGFAADLAPDIDVNSNPANPVIGTRSFGDDPSTVGDLGQAFANGLNQSGVVATYKHFPGHGDTSTDSHIGTPTVNKTKEELEACELVPFRAAIAQGADMIMTAHITLPEYDDQVQFADGTMGNYPSTMSQKVIRDLLRDSLGYDGVVITDALEMDALYEHQLVAPGSSIPAGETKEQRMARLKADATYCAHLAEKCILAGVDFLLVPTDLNGPDAVQFYDNYISRIEIDASNDDETGRALFANIYDSVERILTLKKKYGILNNYKQVDIDEAKAVVGSVEHHEAEMKIAREAITLVKNDDHALPLSGHENNVVIMGRLKDDNKTIDYAIKELQKKGLIAQDAYVNNLVEPGRSSGDKSSKTHITIDYYYDSTSSAEHYTNDLKDAIKDADGVICFTASYGAGPLAGTSPLYQCVSRAMQETHDAGGKFVLLANNLPYDAARYQDADAILLGYMAAGLGADPTDTSSGSVAYNANVIAAVSAIFDDVVPGGPTGMLPVNIPSITENADRSIAYNDDVLYKRGYGLNYEYIFVTGTGGSHTKGSGKNLPFATNARHDKLCRVLVDNKALGEGDVSIAAGSTGLTLAANYLDTLNAGKHNLTAVYDYGAGEFSV
ncbi:MAG: glycoside hydrolase family 3 protein, partial [Atopobiaceae bacterium]|nr:glycoside hydrolase family 3 protein [Atopobiaceae bacterium]